MIYILNFFPKWLAFYMCIKPVLFHYKEKARDEIFEIEEKWKSYIIIALLVKFQ